MTTTETTQPESADGLVLVQRRDGVAEIALNRPARKNAVIPALVTALTDALESAERDPDVHAILLHGAGGAFCSGLDLKDPGSRQVGPLWQQLHRTIDRLATPVVIAHEGAAINAGAALALSGDLIIAGRTAFLQVMEAKIGMTPPVNLGWLLHRHSRALTTRLVLSCDRVVGPELATLGIAHAVVDDAEVLDTARAMAARIAGYPEGTGAVIKRLIAQGERARERTFGSLLDALVGAQ